MGEFSAATRLTVKALRLYHDEGILVPERIDPFSGYRYYGDASWKRARSVSLLRELGFSHRELKD
ncbi:MAG: MerR family transcriptional regulator, partial [Spirochaetes bacterium]|nr:MerR family transcriptional regulator [Spirochaetota bacterium]